MSHFSLNLPSSDTLWYTPTTMDHHHHQKPLPFFYHSSLSLSSKLDDVDSDNNSTSTATAAIDRSETTSSSPSSADQEYMFEKPLTPSDVGKLNRLVIPKQHAEKYFPLANATAVADSSGDKTTGAVAGGGGVLLGFEDESGKCWKFRYSYWNSSQSYVLTKGWSRYVKEKKLDAGDVVLFQRHRFESDRFFIGWRRRGSAPSPHHHHPAQTNNPIRYNNHQSNYSVAPSHGYNNGATHQHQIASFPSYRPDSLHAGKMVNCACGFPCAKRHSWTHENPGRRFEACKKYDHDTGERGCNTFKWLDEDQTEWQREVINTLLGERHRRATELTIIKGRLACVEDHKNLARGMQCGSVPLHQLGICVVVSVIVSVVLMKMFS